MVMCVCVCARVCVRVCMRLHVCAWGGGLRVRARGCMRAWLASGRPSAGLRPASVRGPASLRKSTWGMCTKQRSSSPRENPVAQF